MSGTQNFIPEWQVLYNGTDITKALKESWKETRYMECIGGKACELQMFFADATFAMQNAPPKPGDFVTAKVGYQNQPLADLGTFQVDQYMLQGPPDIFDLRCIEAGLLQPLRTLNSYAYEGKTLGQIARQIAARHGLTAVTDSIQPDVQYARMTQNMESDLSFLHRIAGQHGYDFQVRNQQLIFYSRIALEQQPPSGEVDKLKSEVKRYHLKNQTLGHRLHQTAAITYFDPTTKHTWTETITDPKVPVGDTLKAQERLENNQQAQVKAGAYLHEHNMLAYTGEIDMVGTTQYRAGTTITLNNFGVFDDVIWIVEKATFVLNRRGFITRLSLRTTMTATNKLTKGPLGPTYYSAPLPGGTR